MDRPSPVNVCILGHSYDHRLQKCMHRHCHDKYDNLGCDRSRIVVHCIGVGGATVLPGVKCIVDSLPDVARIQPAIVFVNVGENDLGTVRGNVLLITSHLCHFLAQLTPHTRLVFVSQLLLFPVYNTISKTVLSVDNNLKCH